MGGRTRIAAGMAAVALAAALDASPAPANDTVAAAVNPAKPPAAVGGPDCAVPPRLARLKSTLPQTMLRLSQEEDLKIVAIGSSSTQGVGASSPGSAYPAQLEAELGRRFPFSDIVVLNRGVGGELARDMLGRIERDAIDKRPHLVIWQTGTNDADRNVAPEKFMAELKEGIARLRAANVEVLIVDPQYSPRAKDRRDYAAYAPVFETLGEEPGVAVFGRFAVMRHWIDSKLFTFATMLAPDRFHMNDASYRCLAVVLAEAIERAYRER